MIIKFRGKSRDGSIKLPAIDRRHCDMHAFRTSRSFGAYANSDLFRPLLARCLKARGIGESIDLAAPPLGVTVDTSGFLADVTIDVPDERCW